ncbi:addiction module antidote protein [Klebsiella pneumoniae]
MKDRSHDTVMAECFRADPHYAAELLAEVRREGNPAELAILLRQMTTQERKHRQNKPFSVG